MLTKKLHSEKHSQLSRKQWGYGLRYPLGVKKLEQFAFQAWMTFQYVDDTSCRSMVNGKLLEPPLLFPFNGTTHEKKWATSVLGKLLMARSPLRLRRSGPITFFLLSQDNSSIVAAFDIKGRNGTLIPTCQGEHQRRKKTKAPCPCVLKMDNRQEQELVRTKAKINRVSTGNKVECTYRNRWHPGWHGLEVMKRRGVTIQKEEDHDVHDAQGQA